MAKSASATDIFAFDSRLGELAPLGHGGESHGGELAVARRLFPGAPEPFIDLSTGINPGPYPLPDLAADIFARLPEPEAARALAAVAARAYGAPTADCVVPAPGTQILLPIVAGLVPPGRSVILTPSYGEFSPAAARAGHRVATVARVPADVDAELVVLANPNNPDGRLVAKSDLMTLAERLDRRGGMLVVDEAFMDVGPPRASMAAEVLRGNIVVLRSFGKFFGLAGLRLGFAISAPPTARSIAARLGPWAVSGPALAVGTKALADTHWIEAAKRRLSTAAQRLDGLLTGAGLRIVGGTTLFRLAESPAASSLFHHLGTAGILARRFAHHRDWLRFGLPADEPAWRRLRSALVEFRKL